MIEVIPAILPKSYEDLKNKVSLVRGVVPIVQVDICDGVFVPSMTWPFYSPSGGEGISNAELDTHFTNIINEQEGMPFWEDIDFELDLMVHDAVANFDIYTKLGPTRMIFHVEAVGDLGEFKDFLEGMDMYIRDSIEIGIALSPSTPLEDVLPLVPFVSFVQFMGNDLIGQQGVDLDEEVYNKIRTLREKYADLSIGIDIGVNDETAPLLVEAGATCLVAGSAIFNADDIIGKIESYQEL